MTQNSFEFEVLPQSWSKRRALDKTIREVCDYTVHGFKKIDGHRCHIDAQFDNGDHEHLLARVYANKTHQLVDGVLSEVITSWGLQGTNPNGVSLVLRLKP